MAVKQSFSKFIESWGDELLSKSDRVRNLIGDAHWLSDGKYKEFLVSDFLRRYLGGAISVSSGFIMGNDGSISKEVDIILYDASRHSCLFNEGGLSIVPERSLVASIEVKSTYGKNEITDALAKVLSVRCLLAPTSRQINWAGVFFFQGDKVTAKRLGEHVRTAYRDMLKDQVAFGLFLFSPPLCIAIANESVSFVGMVSEKQVQVRMFTKKTSSVGAFFGDLLASIRIDQSVAASSVDEIFSDGGGVPEKYQFDIE